jgi:chemotaxis response regulator CheB
MRSLEGPDPTFGKPARADASVPARSVTTRILVLEQHPLLRDGITDFLNAQTGLLVCGEADNIRDARSEIAKSKPQLLLTALRLGTGDSLEFVKALRAEKPGLLILVYSAFEEAIFAERGYEVEIGRTATVRSPVFSANKADLQYGDSQPDERQYVLFLAASRLKAELRIRELFRRGHVLPVQSVVAL